MNKIIIFLIVISFIVCQPSKDKIEEMRQRRKDDDKNIADCILKNENTSAELKKLIEENKDEDLIKVLHPRDHKLERGDLDIIRKCRKEIFDKRREEIRKKREQLHPNHGNL